MNKLKYFLLIFILFLVPKTFCIEFNMNAYTSATLGGTKNRYRGTEIDITGSANTYTFGTQYNGRLSVIETYFDYPFAKNLTYRLTYNMNTDDFRNNFGARYWWDCSHTMNATNQHVGTLTYVSYKKVQFTFTPTESTNCIRVMIGSSNVSTGAITGVSNWRLNNITIYDPDFQGGGSGQGTSTPTPTPVSTPNATNQDIINNNNENTQDIINNNNENTQNIINNNNENATCPVGPHVIDIDTFTGELGKLNSDGSISSNVSLTVSKYFIVRPNTEYTLSYTNGSYSGSYYCLYTNSKTVITCFPHGTNNLTFTTTGATTYVRFTLNSGKAFSLNGPVCNNWQQEGINETNSYLKDDSDPNIEDNEFTNLFNSVGFNDPLSYLLQLPVQFINQLVSQSNACQTISLGTLWGVSLSLPCIDIGSIIGQQVWDIIDVLFSVGLLVVIFKNLYQTFANLMTMGGEKEAREKFSMPTPMEFLSLILGGDR